VTISIRTSKKWIKIVLFFIAVTPLCNRFGWEIIAYETFSPEGIAIFVTICPGLLTHLLSRHLTFSGKGPNRYSTLRP
jgi:hypothetical protein